MDSGFKETFKNESPYGSGWDGAPIMMFIQKNEAPSKLDCDPEEARAFINKAVVKATEGKIQNLVENVSPELVLLMASAALFKGSWTNPFKQNMNSIETFYNADGTKVKVEMMNQGNDHLRMAYDNVHNAEILELPFHGSISLWLISSQIVDLEKFMTEENMFQTTCDSRFYRGYP